MTTSTSHSDSGEPTPSGRYRRSIRRVRNLMRAPRALLQGVDVPRLNAAGNRALVSAYKVVGFLVLTTILVGITGFVGVHTFYLVHRAWVVPRIISPGDPEVLALQARLAEEIWNRASIERERRTLAAKLEQLQLVAHAEQAFRDELPRAIESGAAQRKESLEALEAARAEQSSVAAELSRIGQSLREGSREQLERDHAARLITEQERLEGMYQLAQLARVRSDLMDRSAQLGERIRTLSREVGALEAATANATEAADAGPLSYEGLQLRREHALSRAAGVGARAESVAAEHSLVQFDEALRQYDELITRLRTNPLLAASERALFVAFLAYDGQGSVQEGAPLYGCHLVLAWCERVGHVARHLPGEHQQSHPVYGRQLRGQWVLVELDEERWAKADILHANRPPILF